MKRSSYISRLNPRRERDVGESQIDSAIAATSRQSRLRLAALSERRRGTERLERRGYVFQTPQLELESAGHIDAPRSDSELQCRDIVHTKRPVSLNRKPWFDDFRPMFGCNRPTWCLLELKGNSVAAAEGVKPTDIGTCAIFEVVRQRS